MKKEVHLCEICYEQGKEVVCDSFCLYCEKTLCKMCEKKLVMEFSDGINSSFRTFDIKPLCEHCLESFKGLGHEFYQKLINSCARALCEQAKKEELIKKTKIKDIQNEKI